MPFDPVDPRQSLPELEHGILQYWQTEEAFKRSMSLRKGGPHFSFYDGPPFATGTPHYGHLLGGTIKDVIPRYRTMRGDYVERRFGWDCHGLPVENEIEKEQGITHRQQIEEMGVGAFNALCRGAVQRFTKEWRKVVERMGRWVDMDWDYRTMDPEYMESIWWVFAQLYGKDLIYEGHKPMHICPRCVTPLSNFEVTLGYKEVTDLSVIAKFAFVDQPNTFLLAWTTTPWTLPGNLFLAVKPRIKYAIVESDGARFVVAKTLVTAVFKERPHTIVDEVTSKDLLGKTYEPLFPYFTKEYHDTAYRIVAGDFVTTDDGTGIVHIAPGFGEDDFSIGKKQKAALLQHVAMDGRFVDAVSDFAGLDVKPKDDSMKTDRRIVEWLEKHGKVFSSASIRHSYPHCWRCDSPLLNYATSSWFVAVEKIKEKLLLANAETEWVPEHLRDGRFGKWLENARDWAISRNRYWGTPLPIWRCKETGDIEVIGSRDDLLAHQRIRFTKVTVLRHAESEGNVQMLYQGLPPGTDLTQKGRAQAAETAERLRNANVSMIYASPLARTKQTAEIIRASTDAALTEDARLRETQFGDYEGKSIDRSDLAHVHARRAHRFKTGASESAYHLEGMETWDDVHARVSDFLKEILPRHRGQHIVIVTHADALQNIRNFFGGEEPLKIARQPFPSYASPVTFFWDHSTQAELDLHKDTVDNLLWPGTESERTVTATLVRHGQTDWNRDRIVQGRIKEVPLNDTGREQVRSLAQTLKGKHFDGIVCSSLDRARESASILSKELNVAIVGEWSELDERSFGDLEHKNVEEAYAHTGLRLENEQLAMHPSTFPGGESLSAFLERAQRAYERLFTEFAARSVLVVCHGGMVQALRTVDENLSWQEAVDAAPKNAEAYEMTVQPLMKRIPEVLDCWFESGSMPYAQGHFPFDVRNPKDSEPPGFPADFIAEGIDQTRGWFYTLMVIGAALFGKPAFRHCIVNGIVLAEDGRKMSKRLKNYPEPTAIMEQYGADALRFTLMSSPAVRGEDLRFSQHLVEQTLRSVLLPLWNAYSFFVTYANAAHFDPPLAAHASAHPLDRYLEAEMQDLTNRITRELDAYDLSATCGELQETMDALTNWYIRLSRRRFAGKGSSEEEQHAALGTLHRSLLTLSRLLAPFCPFLTEAIYLNLSQEEHGSVHFTDWPAPRALTPDEEGLLRKNRLMRSVVSLGLKVRSEKNIKLRQPLGAAVVAVPPSLLDPSALTEADRELLRQEINVKSLTLIEDPGALAERIAQVNARVAGPRLGARVQEIIVAGKRGDFEVKDDGSILILEELLSPAEAVITYRGKEGHDIAADRGIVVSVDTTITEALQTEGLARDLIRAVQQLRKDAGLEMHDRITLAIGGLENVLKVHGDLIARETNATIGKAEGQEHMIELEGNKVTIRFVKH